MASALGRFTQYNAEQFHLALDEGRTYPEAWVHLATWWQLTGRCPEWPPRPPEVATPALRPRSSLTAGDLTAAELPR